MGPVGHSKRWPGGPQPLSVKMRENLKEKRKLNYFFKKKKKKVNKTHNDHLCLLVKSSLVMSKDVSVDLVLEI